MEPHIQFLIYPAMAVRPNKNTLASGTLVNFGLQWYHLLEIQHKTKPPLPRLRY